ncbi:uncharacterized protein M437DRAFT_11106 [Aureobasidium melanogenum CBS 110374]
MSKYISDFFAKANQNFNLGEKFKAPHSPGSRILPSKTNKNDADYQMRIDAGDMTHGKLATASFDTAAEDPQKEAARVVEELRQKAKENL